MGWNPTNGRVERVQPILRVTDMHVSLEWYQEVLGFRKLWGAEPPYETFCAVGRDHQTIMLCEGAQGCSETWVWIGVEDLEPFHESCEYHGAKIVLPPTSYSWGYEFAVEDPDGHVLRFGCEPRKDLPFLPPD